MDRRVLQWSLSGGCLVLSCPAAITAEEMEEIEQVIAITLRGMRRVAKRDAEATTTVEDDTHD